MVHKEEGAHRQHTLDHQCGEYLSLYILSAKANIRLTTCLLCDGAKDLWREVVRDLKTSMVESITWEDFVTRFKREFVPKIGVQYLAQEYLALKQTIEMVTEITTKFRERALLFLRYATRGDEDDSLPSYVEGGDSRVYDHFQL